MYKDNTKVKSALFNGTVLDRILLNGVRVFERLFYVFENGIFHSSCGFMSGYNNAIIKDGYIYNTTSAQTQYCYIYINGLTDYKLLKIKGQYYYSGTPYLSYGLNNSQEYLSMGESGTEYTIEIDVTEYTGLGQLGMGFSIMSGSSDNPFIENYISEITLE